MVCVPFPVLLSGKGRAMGELRFNLYEGMAVLKVMEACHIAPVLRPYIEEMREEGMTYVEIVQSLARIIETIETEEATKQ